MQKNLDGQFELAEDKRKGKIFNYFIGTVWVVGVIDLINNLYLSLALDDQAAQVYASYIPAGVGNVILFGLAWLGHRWFPRTARHIFLFLAVLTVTLSFPIEELRVSFIGLSLPIIMAAFLIKPIYSFAYWLAITAIYILRLFSADLLVLEEIFYAGLIALLVISVVAWVIARSLENALLETWILNQELDQRVQDRTQELSAALEREQALAARNETILQSIADGILVLDANQKVLMANPAANQLARRNLQSVHQTNLFQAVPDEARNALQAWLNGHRPKNQNNIRFDWHNRTLSANVAPVILPQEDGEHVDAGRVMVLRDFTREAQLERAKDFFLSMVSHELRTPMSAIQGYVEVLLDLEKENLAEESYEYLQSINLSVKQLLTLANDLIDLSRLETGEIDLYREWVDLTDIVDDAVKIVQREFANRNLKLEIHIDDHLPKLNVDSRRILQILLNLLSNAYKYTIEGGAAVNVSQSEAWIEVAVTDTGAGIKPEDHPRLFQRFFRAGDQVIQKAGGTGLGLSISKGLTELHGGTLTFESEYGSGTTFLVKLPKNGVLSPENTN